MSIEEIKSLLEPIIEIYGAANVREASSSFFKATKTIYKIILKTRDGFEKTVPWESDDAPPPTYVTRSYGVTPNPFIPVDLQPAIYNFKEIKFKSDFKAVSCLACGCIEVKCYYDQVND
jgi:hypothetical protein